MRLGSAEQEHQPLGRGLRPGEAQRLVEQPRRQHVDFGRLRPPPGLAQPLQRPLDEVLRQAGHEAQLLGQGGGHAVVERHPVDDRVVDPVAGHLLLDPLGDLGVAPGPLRLGERRVGDLADEVGAERPAVADQVEDLHVDEAVDRGPPGRRTAGVGGDLLQHVQRARAADHRGVLDHGVLLAAEAVEAGRHEAPQRLGQFGFDRGRRRPLGQLPHLERLLGAVGERHQLLEEERVASAADQQRVPQVVRQVPVVDEVLEQLGGGGAVEGIEVDDDVVVAAAARRPARVDEVAGPGHQAERSSGSRRVTRSSMSARTTSSAQCRSASRNSSGPCAQIASRKRTTARLASSRARWGSRLRSGPS